MLCTKTLHTPQNPTTNYSMSIVGRSEGSDLRHVRLHLGYQIRGRYPRSDLQYSKLNRVQEDS